jgi:DNA (cytosine-5)-methyltransferase 1
MPPLPVFNVSTVRSAIGKMPKAGISGDALHDWPEKRSARVRRLIRSVPKDGGSRSQLPRNHWLKCHKVTNGFSDVYGRMKWDEPAPTITGGCFNPSKGRFLHPDGHRAITLREAAILQGFPRDYRFSTGTGKQDLAAQIGNALPPAIVTAHAKAIRHALRAKPT